ncbi:hypothetical protein O2W18_11795 [Modestobacter sp. VKM Ac-2983]|uniref:hypothetical protein n=1 Tax=Modestobacter sp. VKM Ac-2983 TaxID=3004137 RepID=UPI0022AB8923|nr:hypothetical protein [Modestobacter sp. VKM Ac-2983]MCZ2805788.1 hypothetical protein [Modestobacter sp. VKM Ac-2983]
MSVPGQPRPVPSPPGGARPGPVPPAGPDPVPEATAGSTAPGGPGAPPFADLAGRPVAEHVAVFEAEHERLQRELSTIDQL